MNAHEWACFQMPSPSLGVGGSVLLTPFSMMDGEVLVLEGVVEIGDQLLEGSELGALSDRGLDAFSPVGNNVTLPLRCHCISAHHPLKSGMHHRIGRPCSALPVCRQRD